MFYCESVTFGFKIEIKCELFGHMRHLHSFDNQLLKREKADSSRLTLGLLICFGYVCIIYCGSVTFKFKRKLEFLGHQRHLYSVDNRLPKRDKPYSLERWWFRDLRDTSSALSSNSLYLQKFFLGKNGRGIFSNSQQKVNTVHICEDNVKIVQVSVKTKNGMSRVGQRTPYDLLMDIGRSHIASSGVMCQGG